jgi:hypothetical protein
MTTEPLLTQREAAAMLRVSVAWLRASECPKVLLPGNGPKRRPVVRYRESEINGWAEKRTKRSTLQKAG